MKQKDQKKKIAWDANEFERTEYGRAVFAEQDVMYGSVAAILAYIATTRKSVICLDKSLRGRIIFLFG